MVYSMPTQATLKLEQLVQEFERDVIPALIAFSQSKEYIEFTESLRGKDKWEITRKLWDFEKKYSEDNNLGVEYRDEQLAAVLIREEGLDAKGIYHRVYMAILEEIRANLPVDEQTFIYPAIGHDWRVADAWPQSKIIGIDPAAGELTWQRPNVNLLNYDAEDYGAVQRKMGELGLPTKASLILKGSEFCLHSSPEKHARGWQHRIYDLATRLLGRTPPIPTSLSEEEQKEAFNRLVSSYLVEGGLILALSDTDIRFCDSYLNGFLRKEAISPQFREALKRWENLEKRYTSVGIPLGFWHFTSEPFAYKK